MSNTKNEKTLYEMDAVVSRIIEDVESRARKTLDKHKSIPKLPPYKAIKKSEDFYRYYDGFLNIQDEILETIVRVELVVNQLKEITDTRLSRNSTLTNNYSDALKFKEKLESAINRLKQLKFALWEIKRNTNDRVKLFQGMLFKNFE